MKILRSFVCVLVAVCMMIISIPSEAENPTFVPGTYQGKGEGRNGFVDVEVTFSDSRIETITVKSHAETPGISDGALELIPKMIIESQSLNTDAISGATITSEAIIKAVINCVQQAGGDVEALQQKDKKNYEKVLTSGAYRAAARGHHSDVVVEVVIADNVIRKIEVVEERETYNIGEAAFEVIPEQIVKNQSISVDTVAGATYTSQALISAVANCLVQAGGENALLAFSDKVVSAPWSDEIIELDYDVVVVGSGMAGIAAALAAQENGAEVALLEKLSYFGGISQTAAGGFVYPSDGGNGIEGFIERLINRSIGVMQGWMDTPNAIINKESVKVLAENSFDAIKWMEEKNIELFTMESSVKNNYQILNEQGQMEPRTHMQNVALWKEDGASAPDVGAIALKKLVNTFTSNGGDLYLETPAYSLITDDAGSVVGVKAKGKKGQYTFNAKAVCLCAGGFGASEEAIAEYAPAYMGETNVTLVSNTGDGIKMGQEIGAAIYEDAYMMGGSGHTIVSDAVMISPYADAVTPKSAVYVNPQGIRVNSEDPEAYSNSILHVNPDSRDYYWIIINEDVAAQSEYINILKEQMSNGDERFFKAESLSSLANLLGIVPNTLINTMDNYNRLCEIGQDTHLFKNPKYLVEMKEGPWYAVKAYMQYFGTVGGLITDENAAVLNKDGQIISGLFSAGENSNHGVFARCYSGGISLTEALTFGRIAGINAAKEALE